MAPFSPSRWLRRFFWAGQLLSNSRPNLTPRRRRGRTSPPPWLESLEDRITPATLPAPIVNNVGLQSLPFTYPTNAPANYPLIDAQVLVDPSNSQHVVAVASYDPVAPNN